MSEIYSAEREICRDFSNGVASRRELLQPEPMVPPIVKRKIARVGAI
jgi:hypothetical protein